MPARFTKNNPGSIFRIDLLWLQALMETVNGMRYGYTAITKLMIMKTDQLISGCRKLKSSQQCVDRRMINE